MPDIFHDFPIQAPPARVFAAVSTPAGLDQWWTARSSGTPAIGNEYVLWFGPEFDWRGRVTRCVPDSAFELEIVRAGPDWVGSRVAVRLAPAAGGGTQVRFTHTGWPEANEHYRISCYCWAMYLRILKRYLEAGETVPYERRLDV